eukprot:8677354-Alexandrium_andersonii.AAC.1
MCPPRREPSVANALRGEMPSVARSPLWQEALRGNAPSVAQKNLNRYMAKPKAGVSKARAGRQAT